MKWHNDLPAVQVRVARPTDKLQEVISFYNKGLGLPIIGSFEDHQGYDGVMVGLPGMDYHLEFTSHRNGSPCPAPTKDNLLVLYLGSMDKVESMTVKLATMGHHPVEPENPYWKGISATIEDPDGWRVVLVGNSGFSSQ